MVLSSWFGKARSHTGRAWGQGEGRDKATEDEEVEGKAIIAAPNNKAIMAAPNNKARGYRQK